MSSLHAGLVAVRRLLARRPWVHWILVAGVAVAVGVAVHAEVEELRRSRDEWAERVPVLIAAEDISPGSPIVFDRAEAPRSIVPEAPASEIGDRPARRRIGAGEIITTPDLARVDGPLAIVPNGWRAVPIVESPVSGAEVGDHVDVTTDGVVVAPSAIVVHRGGDVTLVAVPADRAPLLASANASTPITLLRIP